MDQLMIMGKQRAHAGPRTRSLDSVVRSIPPYSRSRRSSQSRQTQAESRVVFPGRVIQLRCDIALSRSRALVESLPTSATDKTTSQQSQGRLKSARLLPLGVVPASNSNHKCLGIVTTKPDIQVNKDRPKSSTVPAAVPTGNTVTVSSSGKRRIQSAIPLSRTSVAVGDLLSTGSLRLHQPAPDNKELTKHKDSLLEQTELSKCKEIKVPTHPEDTLQESSEQVSLPPVNLASSNSNIKIKVVFSNRPIQHVAQQTSSSELPALPQDLRKQNKTDTKVTPCKQSSSGRKYCTKLTPLTGAHHKQPIGTLTGNCVYKR